MKNQLAILIMSSTLMLPALAKAAALSAPDKSFMMNTAQAGMTEVKLGELADKKSSNKDVKAFAEKMVSDHTKANESLKELASKKSVTLPENLDAKHQALYDKLSKLSGDAFDNKYMNQMVMDHKTVIADLKKEGKTGEPDLKAWADKTLPTIEEHLKLAQTTTSSLHK